MDQLTLRIGGARCVRGGIVALEAGLNEMVELRVNGVTIAHGELVAVGDRFGVRIVKVAQ